MKPIIGILPTVDNNKKSYVLNSYVHALEISGAASIMLPYTENQECIEAFSPLCDGFLFSGGGDVAPSLYNEEKSESCGEITPYRDSIELSAFKLLLKTGKPILGICRGAQIINVALGGTLHQHIPTMIENSIDHSPSLPHNALAHEVILDSNSPLFYLLKKRSIEVTSRHHQSVKQLGYGLSVMASSSDSVIEGIYMPKHRFLWGVQWHPESTVDCDHSSIEIFKHFINKAKMY